MGSRASEFITFFERLQALRGVIVIVSKRIPVNVQSAGWLIDACSRVKRGGGELVQVDDASGVLPYAIDKRAKLCVVEGSDVTSNANLQLTAGPCLTLTFPPDTVENYEESGNGGQIGGLTKNTWTGIVAISAIVLLVAVLMIGCRARKRPEMAYGLYGLYA